MSPPLAAALGAIAGAIIGSFIATIALRWPQGRSVARGRSVCDGCGRALSALEIIPIASWLVVRGKCRTCGSAIAREHIIIELASTVIGAAAFGFTPHLGGVALALLGWQLLLLGWLDARHWWLPHRLSAALAASGLLFGGVAMTALGFDAGLTDRAIGMVVGYTSLAAIAFLYRRLRGRDGLGGGDAPMLGALGAWTGWAALPFVLLFAALAGIAAALVRRLSMGQDTPLAAMRLPLGTLMALAVPFALLAMRLPGG
ncbi:MAG: prepilin peptidase [Sphingopyxis sp.]